MNKDENIKYAGSKKSHPLEQNMIVKFRTLEDCNPTEILMDAIERIKMDVYSLKKNYIKNLTNEKMEEN